jgi:hypothetical protein
MSKELKSIGENYRKASSDSFASVVRSTSEIHRGFQGIASEMMELLQTVGGAGTRNPGSAREEGI